MGLFTVGQVVVLPFPFSNLKENKYRPGLLLANVEHGDWIVCQVTSKSYECRQEFEINNNDFVAGNLRQVSYVRAGKLFTANESIFTGIIGQLKPEKLRLIKDAVILLMR